MADRDRIDQHVHSGDDVAVNADSAAYFKAD